MNTLGMTYMLARSIREGQMTREDAIAECGHLIDSETLDEVLASLDCVRHEEDMDGEDIMVIQVPDTWQRTWSEEDSPQA